MKGYIYEDTLTAGRKVIGYDAGAFVLRVIDRKTANERIPHLLKCPAAVRFLSAEPLLGPVDLLRVDAAGFGGPAGHKVDCIRKGFWSADWGFVNHSDLHDQFGDLHWVIVGGESGHNARPCDIEFIRRIVNQCRDASVPVFVKQMGAKLRTDDPEFGDTILKLQHPKGADMDEWPDDLREREWPKVATGGVA